MREYLFRGQRIDTKEWVEGDLIHHYENQRKFIACDQMAYTYIENGINRIVSERYFEVIPKTVGQYTGLKDKNDKMIFEGDIVKHGYSNNNGDFYYNGCVVYVVNDGAFEISGEDTYLKRLTQGMIIKRNITVIGNIHDNPELKEGDK